MEDEHLIAAGDSAVKLASIHFPYLRCVRCSERRLSSAAYRNQVSIDMIGLDTSLRSYSTGAIVLY